MSGRWDRGRTVYLQTGDKIEIVLKDASYNPYFRATANLNDRKEVQELIEKLKTKGVNFPLDFI